MKRAEFTAVIKKQGNSNCIFIPLGQMQILEAEVGDVVKVTITKRNED